MIFADQVTPSNLIEWVSKYWQKHVLKNKVRLNKSETDDFGVQNSKFNSNLSFFYSCEFDQKLRFYSNLTVFDAANFLADSVTEWQREQMAGEK